MSATHVITHGKSPVAYVARCSCGWSVSTPRRQNALARAAKIKSAVARHLAESSPIPLQSRKE